MLSKLSDRNKPLLLMKAGRYIMGNDWAVAQYAPKKLIKNEKYFDK